MYVINKCDRHIFYMYISLITMKICDQYMWSLYILYVHLLYYDNDCKQLARNQLFCTHLTYIGIPSACLMQLNVTLAYHRHVWYDWTVHKVRWFSARFSWISKKRVIPQKGNDFIWFLEKKNISKLGI